MEIQTISTADAGMANNNPGGMSARLFVVKHTDIEGLELPTNPTNPDDIVQIAFGGLSFIGPVAAIECQEGSVVVNDELIGEVEGKSFKNTVGFKVSGNDAKNLGFAAATKNARLVIFAEDFGSGNIRVIGSRKSAARLAGGNGIASGAKREDFKHGDFMFEAYSNAPAAIITGATYTDFEALVGSGS